MPEWSDPTQDALNRMKRASERGTGCHLTAEMIQNMKVTIIGDLWSQPDPRDVAPSS